MIRVDEWCAYMDVIPSLNMYVIMNHAHLFSELQMLNTTIPITLSTPIYLFFHAETTKFQSYDFCTFVHAACCCLFPNDIHPRSNMDRCKNESLTLPMIPVSKKNPSQLNCAKSTIVNLFVILSHGNNTFKRV